MESPEQIGAEPKQIEQESKIIELNLGELKTGDKIKVKTAPGGGITDYEITIIGKRKGVFIVSVESWSDADEGGQTEAFIAKLPGGFLMGKGGGITDGILKIADEQNPNCLFLIVYDIQRQESGVKH